MGVPLYLSQAARCPDSTCPTPLVWKRTVSRWIQRTTKVFHNHYFCRLTKSVCGFVHKWGTLRTFCPAVFLSHFSLWKSECFFEEFSQTKVTENYPRMTKNYPRMTSLGHGNSAALPTSSPQPCSCTRLALPITWSSGSSSSLSTSSSTSRPMLLITSSPLPSRPSSSWPPWPRLLFW